MGEIGRWHHALCDPGVGSVQGERFDILVGDHAARLSDLLQTHRPQLYPIETRQDHRRFTSGEVAALLGVKDAYLRKLSLEGRGPVAETGAGGRRLYTPADVQALRELLEKGARLPGTYLPGRRGDDALQVIATINFRHGSGKTTVATHLAQKLALDGYSVLALDLDPQARLSALHGLQPEFDQQPGSLYDALRYDDPVPLRGVIRATHIVNLDIVPGGLELLEFEQDTPRALAERDGGLFFTRITDALSGVADAYDTVIIDCPAQPGFLTMSALSAASAVLVAVQPQMPDVMSMCQFMSMTSGLLSVVAGAGGDMRYDWMRYVVTRHDPADSRQNRIVSYMRTAFGDHVLNQTLLESDAIGNAGRQQRSLYDCERGPGGRATRDRALENLNTASDEIAALILRAWGRMG